MLIHRDENLTGLSDTVIVGVGGCGISALNELVIKGICNEIDMLAVDTDLMTLDECAAPDIIQIGTSGIHTKVL